MLRLICTVLGVAACSLLNAQKPYLVDKVYLKDGSSFIGRIVAYQIGDTLELQLLSGDKLVVAPEQLEKVQQGLIDATAYRVYLRSAERKQSVKTLKGDSTQTRNKPYAFRETGWYNATSIAMFNPSGALSYHSWGVGAQTVVGYQLNRRIGAGLGIGIDTYDTERGETLYPVFAEVRSYLLARKISPYLLVQGGYGLAFKNTELGLNNAKGGLYLHPAIGYRLGGSAGVNVTLDLGVKFQDASFERTYPWGETEERLLTYRRLTVRTGLVF